MREAIGVIGGIGPAATAYFMERVIDFTMAQKDQEHINLMVLNHCTIPDRTDWITGRKEANPLPMMKEDAQDLEKMGCQFIVIPCNTAHFFYDDIQSVVSIPVVNIVKETVRYAAAQVDQLKTLGIMATNGTIYTHTYQKAAEKRGLTWVVPDEAEQEAVMALIYDGVKAGKVVSRDDFDVLANHLRDKGADCIVLGCTELSVLKHDLKIEDMDILDSIDVLAAETVRRSGKPLTTAARQLKGVAQ